jgi:hypothetical protein
MATDQSNPAEEMGAFFFSPKNLLDAGNFFLALPHLQATALSTLVQRQQDTLAFCEERRQALTCLARDLEEATSLPEVISAYAAFGRQAWSDYSAQARLAFERSGENAVSTVRAAQAEVEKFGVAPLREAA